MSRAELVVHELELGLVLTELAHNTELRELLAVARDALTWNDSLPHFNRRHFILLIKRLKKYSDNICHDLERDWLTDKSIALQLDKVYDCLNFNLNTNFALSCVAYCDTLDELRGLLRRAITQNNADDLKKAYSPRFNIERALTPLQRLSSQKLTLQKINAELPNTSPEASRCQKTLENVTTILDRCFEVLASLHGTYYVISMDNLLDFSQKLSVMKYRNQRTESKGYKEEIPSEKATLERIRKVCDDQQLEELKDEISRMVRERDTPSRRLDSDLIDLSSIREPSINSSGTHQACAFDEGQQVNDYEYCANYEDNDHIYEEIESRPIDHRFVRTFWCETEVVINSGLLEQLSSKEKALQESKFEIITTEVSYHKNLCILITLFYESSEIQRILTPDQMSSIFANILEVRAASEKLLYELTGHFEEDVLLPEICGIVRSHAVSSFHVYIEYCISQANVHKTLESLLETEPELALVLRRLEGHGPSLASFLTLPMQRITRLPLLVQAIHSRLHVSSPELTPTLLALSALNQLVSECNEGIRNSEKTAENEYENPAMVPTTRATQKKRKLSIFKLVSLTSLKLCSF